MDTTYNGWANRETWLVNVWFNPESLEDVHLARMHIEEAVEAMPNYLRDFCNTDAINWEELEAAFADETEEE